MQWTELEELEKEMKEHIEKTKHSISMDFINTLLDKKRDKKAKDYIRGFFEGTEEMLLYIEKKKQDLRSRQDPKNKGDKDGRQRKRTRLSFRG